MSEEATLDEFSQSNESEDGGGKTEDNHPRFESLPDGWDISKVVEIAEVVGGSTPSTSNEDYWGGGIPWATPTDITGLSGNTIEKTADTLTQEGLESASTHLLPPYSVLMTSRATIGECAVNTVDMATNQGFKSLVPEENIETWYLHYRMSETAAFLESLGAGSTFDEVSKSVVESVEIPVPPLPQQRKIATALYTVDQAIQNTEEIIEQNGKLKKGLRREIFQQGGLSDEKTTTRRIGPKEYKMPEDWEVTNLSQVAEIKGGQGFKSSNYVEKGVPLIKISNVQNGYLDLQDTSYLPEEYLNEYSDVALSKGDVVLVLTRPIIGDGIKAARIDKNDNFLLNQRLAVVDPVDENTVAREYLYHLIFTNVFIDQVKATVRATHQPNLSKTDLQNFSIPVPEIEQQRKICRLLGSIEDVVEKNKSYRSNLKTLKGGLMQDLLSGTVGTTDTNIEVPDEIAQHG